jgi:hypothetical protein
MDNMNKEGTEGYGKEAQVSNGYFGVNRNPGHSCPARNSATHTVVRFPYDWVSRMNISVSRHTTILLGCHNGA